MFIMNWDIYQGAYCISTHAYANKQEGCSSLETATIKLYKRKQIQLVCFMAQKTPYSLHEEAIAVVY